MPQGWLTLKMKNGTEFEGDFVKGVKEGKGKFKWIDGSSYEGEIR